MAKTGSWKVHFEMTLEGKDVRFEDLSERTQKRILKCIKDGCRTGEIVEECENENENVLDAPKGENERFPVKTIEVNTKIGKITVEYPVGDNDDDKIRFYDSYGSYLDYMERETFENLAEYRKSSFENEVKAFAEELKDISSVPALYTAIAGEWDMAVDKNNWRLIAEKLLVKTYDEVINNEYVNRIGDMLILVPEC